MVARTVQRGFEVLLLQWDDFAGNRNHGQQVKAYCGDAGVIFGVWESFPEPSSCVAAVQDSGAQCYVAEAERERDWVGIAQTFRDTYPEMPAAIVTNFGGLDDPVKNQALQDARFRCLVECDVFANPLATWPRQAFEASRRGWRWSQPIYYTPSFAQLATTYDLTAPGWGAWSSDTVLY